MLRRPDSIFEKTWEVRWPGFGKTKPPVSREMRSRPRLTACAIADRLEAHEACAFDRINDRAGRLGHLDEVVEADITARIETIGKHDDRFSHRDGLQFFGRAIKAVP